LHQVRNQEVGGSKSTRPDQTFQCFTSGGHQRQPTHLPTHIELLCEAMVRILRPWQSMQSPSSIQARLLNRIRARLAHESISRSGALGAICRGPRRLDQENRATTRREGLGWVFHLWTTDASGQRRRQKKEKKLGPASMPKHEAQQKLAEYIEEYGQAHEASERDRHVRRSVESILGREVRSVVKEDEGGSAVPFR
jgi:hypothetical protein